MDMSKEEELLEVADFNILWVLQHPEELLDNLRVDGWREIAKKKGLLDNNLGLTDEGFRIVKLFEKEELQERQVDFEEWAEELERQLEQKMLDAGKKVNQKGFGGSITFLPTSVEIQKHLKMFWKEYKYYTDLDRIEKILIKHVEDCIKKDNFAPACKYFIYKQRHGTYLASEYKNFKEVEAEEIVVINKKEDLF